MPTIAVVVPCEVGAGSSEARNRSSEVLITLVVGERVGGAVGVAVLSGFSLLLTKNNYET